MNSMMSGCQMPIVTICAPLRILSFTSSRSDFMPEPATMVAACLFQTSSICTAPGVMEPTPPMRAPRGRIMWAQNP